MTSAPVFPPVDVSTPNRLTTDTMPGTIAEFQNVAPLPDYGTYDDFLGYEFWLRTIEWDESLATINQVITIPGSYKDSEGYQNAMRYILGSHDYIDYDLELVIRAYKQERARGKILVAWFPNIDYYSGGNTRFSRVTNQVWDLEATEDFCLDMKGPKDMAWRSPSDNIPSVTPNTNIITYYTENPVSLKGPSIILGTIWMEIASKFQKGVGPSSVYLAFYLRVKNPKMSQYRRFIGKQIPYLPST
ncbi:MAG: capsid protein [Fushun polycipivirus 1]|nr:MAG: capsid protein [Fushun polycipivirus 1]